MIQNPNLQALMYKYHSIASHTSNIVVLVFWMLSMFLVNKTYILDVPERKENKYILSHIMLQRG